MTIYLKISSENIVENAIVIDDTITDGVAFIQTTLQLEGEWLPANLNGTTGVVGDSYDTANDVFIAPQPYASWTLDTNFIWQAPSPQPEGAYFWNEETLSWEEMPV